MCWLCIGELLKWKMPWYWNLFLNTLEIPRWACSSQIFERERDEYCSLTVVVSRCISLPCTVRSHCLCPLCHLGGEQRFSVAQDSSGVTQPSFRSFPLATALGDNLLSHSPKSRTALIGNQEQISWSQGRFRLDIIKYFFIKNVIKH